VPTEPVAQSDSGIRRAAVVGSPVDHSLSPVLHGAAYQALGLSEWTYRRIECDADGLPGLAAGLGLEWVGLSVTMPGKRAALELAADSTARARLVGAANTLTRRADGAWFADCTDVDGVVGAVRVAGGYRASPGAEAVLLGAGGTALATVVAFAELGVGSLTVVVREPARARDVVGAAESVGIRVEVTSWRDADFAGLAKDAALLVSTVPSAAVVDHADDLAKAQCVLDVIYHPWPTALATAVANRGGRVATGLDMLLHQAFGQVEQFTGRPAPRRAMRDALAQATGNVVPLPL
jgi:shikimate dehydrogenase